MPTLAAPEIGLAESFSPRLPIAPPSQSSETDCAGSWKVSRVRIQCLDYLSKGTQCHQLDICDAVSIL